MLEFQEGFFNQEIRERFYLDTTMKTVWASEMELLQKVAEVCDKYGLTWYAAYGTLLGAIRHEGFVPWDDDLDIWLIRDDYNKLMEVLHKEMPEGYRVRGPLANEEYDQFHTCVNNGSSISIEKEWLEQFHNCPFTVGLDIFPLDYLPRNEADREMQKNMFLLTGRVAQLARALDRREYGVKDGEREEEIQKKIQGFKQEIEQGIAYLEKNYHFSINRRLLKDEKWYSLCSEMWKWANHIAMRYNGEESDDLVMYVGYSRQESVVFPKEWFDEVYGASFENFMVPVPSGYDRILKKLYGSYWVPVKNTSLHDYPCYIKQLKQLREYAGKNEEESTEIPGEWLPVVTQKDGSLKKLVLSANDPNMFVMNGDKALDKLEQTLEIFHARKEQLTLWWRPYPAMKKILDQVSSDLGGRYQQILEGYQSAGWGICDETGNTERAVANCDAYYGDLNAILQPFQNAGKPVMIAHIDEGSTYRGSNMDIYRENRLYLSAPSFALDEKKLYFSNRSCNALVIVDRKTRNVESMAPFVGEELEAKELHFECYKQGNKIYFLPQGKKRIHVYDVESKEQKVYEPEGEYEVSQNVAWHFHVWQDKIYLLPCGGGMGLWSLDAAGQLHKESWWDVQTGRNYFVHGDMDERRFFSLRVSTGELTITDLENRETKTYLLPDTQVGRIAYDGQDFWYISRNHADIVRWNPEQGEAEAARERYAFPMWDKCSLGGVAYACIYAAGQEIFVVSGSREELFLLDKEGRILKPIFQLQEMPNIYREWEMTPVLTRMGDQLIWTFRDAGEAAVIDLTTMEGKMYQDVIPVNEKVRDCFDKILMQKGPLLFEDSDGWDLERFLCHFSLFPDTASFPACKESMENCR